MKQLDDFQEAQGAISCKRASLIAYFKLAAKQYGRKENEQKRNKQNRNMKKNYKVKKAENKNKNINNNSNVFHALK